MSNSNSLTGRVALVTGASRGIGAAIAARLAAAGATVAVSARTLDPDPRYRGTLHDTADAIRRGGGQAEAFQADRASAHDLVEDFPVEDPTFIAESALALVEADLTGRVALSQPLLKELGRTPHPLISGLVLS